MYSFFLTVWTERVFFWGQEKPKKMATWFRRKFPRIRRKSPKHTFAGTLNTNCDILGIWFCDGCCPSNYPIVKTCPSRILGWIMENLGHDWYICPNIFKLLRAKKKASGGKSWTRHVFSLNGLGQEFLPADFVGITTMYTIKLSFIHYLSTLHWQNTMLPQVSRLPQAFRRQCEHSLPQNWRLDRWPY